MGLGLGVRAGAGVRAVAGLRVVAGLKVRARAGLRSRLPYVHARTLQCTRSVCSRVRRDVGRSFDVAVQPVLAWLGQGWE